jgi:hypothetical protein
MRPHACGEGDELLLHLRELCLCRWLAEAGGNGDPHLCRADLKAGECGTIDEPNWISPWPSGSRKLGMPCLRMQAANRVPPVAFAMSMTRVSTAPPGRRGGADGASSS